VITVVESGIGKMGVALGLQGAVQLGKQKKETGESRDDGSGRI